MTWLSLSHAQSEGSTIRARFRPDTFRHDEDAPVTEVTIEGVADADRAMAVLSRFRNDFIVALVVASNELRLSADMDVEETIIIGARVSSRSVAYSPDELREFAVLFERRLREEAALAYCRAAKLKDIRHFVADLVERAEKRMALSQKPHDATESRLDLLNRVLHRIDAA